MSSTQKGAVHPPKRKPPVGSSSGPPGACITPSSETNTAAVSSRIGGCAFDRGLDRGDVDLAHRHHRLEGAAPACAAGHGQLEQSARRDLPGEAPAVLAPAARALLAAI